VSANTNDLKNPSPSIISSGTAQHPNTTLEVNCGAVAASALVGEVERRK
jgi:hypothetical protein